MIVLTLDGDQISAVTRFVDNGNLARFGLPPMLAGSWPLRLAEYGHRLRSGHGYPPHAWKVGLHGCPGIIGCQIGALMWGGVLVRRGAGARRGRPASGSISARH